MPSGSRSDSSRLRRSVLAGVVVAGALGCGLVRGATAAHAALPVSASISAPTLTQEYPLDCEAAALQIALSVNGIDTSQDWILGYVGSDPRPAVIQNGVPVEWGDPYETFVGSVNGSEPEWTGYGVYYPPIAAAAQAAGALAFGEQGWTPDQLFAEIAQGHPVVVWVPHLLEDDPTSTWTAWDGRQVWYALGEHAQVLTGYDMTAGTVTLDDPLDGQLHTLSMSLFETRFAQWYSMGVVVGAGLPDAPTPVSASAVGSGAAKVTWAEAGDAAANEVSGYTVATYDARGQQVGSPQSIPGAGTTSTTVTGLTAGSPYYFSVTALDPLGTSPAAESNSVTLLSGTVPAAGLTAVSTDQYLLPNSDGSTWQVMDESNLAFSMTPTSSEEVLLGANADLWTFDAGYNQDIGIQVTAGGGTPTVAAWKESGGYAGTFSPNAAFVETVYPMAASTTYAVQIVWKTNRAAIGATIAAGAGPIGSAYSPTRLTASVLPAGYQSAVSTQQYELANSDGITWKPMDATHLTATLTASADQSVVVSGNADLWTATAGYNQDLGIFVSDDGGASQLVAWQEAGGYAGTFSPNAAFVQAVYTLKAGHSYLFTLEWKTNKPASGATILAGAGPIGSAYSPTRLTVYPLVADTSLWGSAASTSQYSLTSSDGSTWSEMDAVNLAATLRPDADQTVLVSGNADLWTASVGYNQDLGIFVTEDGGTPTLVAWKESGGYAGTLSPNAAFVQAVYTLEAGHSYVFSLEWKTNRPASGVSIYAGAGPIGSAYSPTRVTVVPQMT